MIDSKDINNAMLRIGKQLSGNEDIASIIEEVPTKTSDKNVITFDEFISMFGV